MSLPDGRPRLSPVRFRHVGHRTFHWASSPDARHSKNVAARPEVAIVIYESTARTGHARAVAAVPRGRDRAEGAPARPRPAQHHGHRHPAPGTA